MPRGNFPILALNRGILSPLALARVDLDRTALSAEVMTNWLPNTIGAMRLRPGTKYLGSSYADTGAQWIEFVAATDDTALLEITPGRMRVWIDDALLERPHVDTTVSLSDTGWSNISTGGAGASTAVDLIPVMTGATTSGVTMSANSANTLDSTLGDRSAWRAGDNDVSSYWADTGFFEGGSLPSWIQVDFGAGNSKNVFSYTIRGREVSGGLDNNPRSWLLYGNHSDTGAFPASWTFLDSGGDQTGWAVGERRSFTIGSPGSYRVYRLYITEITGGGDLSGEACINELELFATAGSSQAQFSAQGLVLNATAVGSLASVQRAVTLDTGDRNVEHGISIQVIRGPVTFRVGSSAGNDDYIRETSLGTGYHNLAFVPDSTFYVTISSNEIVDRIVGSVDIADTGTVMVPNPWGADDLDNIRYDQSADVIYVAANDVQQQKIERRGTGRSWSVVEYAPTNGPFYPSRSSSAKLSVSQRYGNTTMNSDVPFFRAAHVGALVRAFHQGQSGKWLLGATNAATGAIEVTGISDTGAPTSSNERRIVFTVTGSWVGAITIERSFDGEDIGFHAAQTNFSSSGKVTDTGTNTFTIDDEDDNVRAWYRARVTSYTSGVATVVVTYGGGGVTGVARITDYQSNMAVGVEVISRFSDTGPTDNWQEGRWSDAQGYPGAVALHEGRLAFAGGANVDLSVSDDYENFDETTEGESAPVNRTLGSGPVDDVYYLLSLQRLIAGTAGSEISLRSSSLDEPLTAQNSSAKVFSTQGSANLRPILVDSRAIFVQRSKQRLSAIGFGAGDFTGDYQSQELSFLVPNLLRAGVVSIAAQRRPDTRIHCVLADGTVKILTYEPQEEVLCWSAWETDGAVERAVVLPGTQEDQVYYHVRREVNGVTRRFLEKWATEAESAGDTGLSWMADCAVSHTDTGRATDIPVAHLVGEGVIVWANDTGTGGGMDMSPDDTGGDPRLYTVDTGGSITLGSGRHHVVAGLYYKADFKSSKLAYAAQAGTALTQQKRVNQIGFVLNNTHRAALLFGADTGHLDPLPSIIKGAPVDPDTIFETFDQVAFSFNGESDPDARVHLRARAPRPITVMAAVPTVQTSERV